MQVSELEVPLVQKSRSLGELLGEQEKVCHNGIILVRCRDHWEVDGRQPFTIEAIIPAELDGLPVTVLRSLTDNVDYHELKRRLRHTGKEHLKAELLEKLYLKRVHIPASIVEVRSCALCTANCDHIADITFDPGVSIQKVGNMDVVWKDPRHVIICQNVTKIERGSFCRWKCIETVTLPDNVTAIEPAAFSWTGLTDVMISKGVKKLEFCFVGCDKLKRLTFEDGSTTEELGNQAFERTGLEKVTIPKSVRYIGSHCFYECSITEVFIEDGTNLEEVSDIAFHGNNKTLSRVSVPNGTTERFVALLEQTIPSIRDIIFERPQQ